MLLLPCSITLHQVLASSSECFRQAYSHLHLLSPTATLLRLGAQVNMAWAAFRSTQRKATTDVMPAFQGVERCFFGDGELLGMMVEVLFFNGEWLGMILESAFMGVSAYSIEDSLLMCTNMHNTMGLYIVKCMKMHS